MLPKWVNFKCSLKQVFPIRSSKECVWVMGGKSLSSWTEVTEKLRQFTKSLVIVMSETRTGPGPGPKNVKAKTGPTPSSTGTKLEDSNSLPSPKPFPGCLAGWLLLCLLGTEVCWMAWTPGWTGIQSKRGYKGHGWKILVGLHLQPPTQSPSLFPSMLPSSTSVTLAMGRRREGKSNGGMGREVRSWQLIVWPLGESERLRGRETRDLGRGRERIIKCPSKALISLTPQACQWKRTGD